MIKTKADLISFVAEETGLTKADATRALDAFKQGIIKALKENGKFSMTGFLTFTAKDKPESIGHNPRTGEKVTIPARTAVSIKAGSQLKDALN